MVVKYRRTERCGIVEIAERCPDHPQARMLTYWDACPEPACDAMGRTWRCSVCDRTLFDPDHQHRRV